MSTFPRSAFLLSLFGSPEPPPASAPPAEVMLVCSGLSPNPGVIDATIKRHVGPLRQCYERARLRDPDAAGRLGVRLLVDESEVVEASLTRDDIGDPALSRCVLDVFAFMHFTLPREQHGLYVVRYPVTFVPEEEQGATRAR